MKLELKFTLLIILVLISRLPFIDGGYGVEEDAWGFGLNALLMAKSGVYEYARIPGHPVLEYIYCYLPVKEAWLFNLCTALMSTLAVAFFYLICKGLNAHAFTGALMLAFTPVFYVNSSNAMDYNWALCFMLGAFYFLMKRKINLSALMIALAVGSRITSGAILLPLSLYLFMMERKNAVVVARYILITLVLCGLVFSPVLLRYGKDFFGYVNQFGYPPIVKSMFKASIGVWGALGFIMISTSVIFAIKVFLKNHFERRYKPALLVCIYSTLLFMISYAYEPHKAAYLISIVPFVILFVLMLNDNRKMIVSTVAVLIVSCFFTGINLADDNRSSSPSPWSLVATINNQKVAFDVLRGNVIDDYDKRKVRMSYAGEVIAKSISLPGKNAIICGYWLNNILMQQRGYEKPELLYLHYMDEKSIDDLKRNGFSVYIIPGQEKFNDQCWNGVFTDRMVKPLF